MTEELGRAATSGRRTWGPRRRSLSAALVVSALLAGVSSAGWAEPRNEARSYDLGEVTIVQESQPPGSRFREMPVALRGVIAVPRGPGPFPVALFVHGAYPFCDAPGVGPEVDAFPCPAEADRRQYEGFGYLMEALADHGYVAIAPDFSAEFNNGFGEPRFSERSSHIIEQHLAALTAGVGFGGDVEGKADPERVAFIGHSRGGSLVLRYVVDSDTTTPAEALVLITPADLAPDVTIPAELSTALVIAECDGDVGTEQPLRFVAQLPPLRPAITTITTLLGGTHEAFSTRLEVRPSPDCDPRRVLSADRQQAWLAAFLPAFLDLALRSERAIDSIPG